MGGSICSKCDKETPTPRQGKDGILCTYCWGMEKVSIPCPACGKSRDLKRKSTWQKEFREDQDCRKCQQAKTPNHIRAAEKKAEALALLAGEIPKKKNRNPYEYKPESVQPSIPGIIPCLKCEKKFKSPDRIRIRTCDSCRAENTRISHGIEDHVFGFGRSCG